MLQPHVPRRHEIWTLPVKNEGRRKTVVDLASKKLTCFLQLRRKSRQCRGVSGRLHILHSATRHSVRCKTGEGRWKVERRRHHPRLRTFLPWEVPNASLLLPCGITAYGTSRDTAESVPRHRIHSFCAAWWLENEGQRGVSCEEAVPLPRFGDQSVWGDRRTPRLLTH